MLMFLLLALVWFFGCAAVGGAIGQRRGRQTTGFLLGFFAGPLGWLIAWVLPETDELMQARCTECGRGLRPTWSHCPDCGATV